MINKPFVKAAFLSEAGITDTRPYAHCSPAEAIHMVLKALDAQLTENTIERAATDIKWATAMGRTLKHALDKKAAEGLIDRKSGGGRTIISNADMQAANVRMHAVSLASPTYAHNLVLAAFPGLEHTDKDSIPKLLRTVREKYQLPYDTIAAHFGENPVPSGRQHILARSRISNRLHGNVIIDVDFVKQFIEAVQRSCAPMSGKNLEAQRQR
jgi:hypothetical protein